MGAYPNSLLERFPAIEDLKKRAKGRIPNVAWQYLQSGTGDEDALKRNIRAFSKVTINPRFMMGELAPSTETPILGKTYSAPFGIAPVGISGLMWPGAESMLAATAARYKIPYCLSTVAAQTPEKVGPLAGDMGWFQLYSPRRHDIRLDVLERAQQNGFHTLVVTADVPKPSRRERTKRAGLRTPPRITPGFIWEGITNPAWTMQVLKNGMPKLRTILKYADKASVFEELRAGFGGTLDWDYLRELRQEWKGPIVIKGLTHPEDARIAVDCGVDGIIVSNHGGRQFDAVPAAIDLLPAIVAAVGSQTTVMFDSGVRSGLDVIRAMYLGAKFVFLGRPFIYGVSALGRKGGDHVCEILLADLHINMLQLGIERLDQLSGLKPE